MAGRNMVLVVLALSTLASASAAAAFSYNYYQFYPSIQRLQLNIPSFSFNPSNTSLNAYAIFTINNPTSYNGLGLTQFEPSFEMYGPNGYVPAGGVITFTAPRENLSPGRTVTFNVSFSGFRSGPGEVYRMVQAGATLSQFNFNFTIGVFLSTFLDTYASIRTLYTCSSQMGGGTCIQVGILLNSTPSPSVGGGGGAV